MTAFTDLVPLSDAGEFNRDLTNARQATMLQIFGKPSQDIGVNCQEITNPKLKALMAYSVNVGPFKVSGLFPAVESLKAILAEVKGGAPDLYAALGTEGMLCCRLVRGSTKSISNHSWGTAIDISLSGVTDKRGDDKVQHGLVLLAPYFNKHRWYWGAGFGTEDGMHFEASDELIRSWLAEGRLNGLSTPGPAVLSMGDRGPAVRALQTALADAGFSPRKIDGDFGPNTEATLKAFQEAKGLPVTGVTDPATVQALQLVEA